MINKIIILAGDPNSINSEIILKLWKQTNTKIRNRIIVIGNYKLIANQSKKLKIKVNLNKLENINEKNVKGCLNIINWPLKFKSCFNVSENEAAKYVVGCLNFAHKLASEKKIKGFINCPIDKNLIKNNKTFGVTEFLAKKSNIKNNSEIMLLYNKKLSVVPLTTHIGIKDISGNIKKKTIVEKIITLFKYYKKNFKIAPKAAILGLNPHNLEFSKKSEEINEIIPAIKKIKKTNKLDGPFVPDNFFINKYKNYNVVIGMYHDQVLIPFKHLFNFDAINITLGLKYIRVSPDHGTAKDIIGKNKANIKSIQQCLVFMSKIK
jgi:4-hydroxy-L-threonine phosphate dehydrogenase PdxA